MCFGSSLSVSLKVSLMSLIYINENNTSITLLYIIAFCAANIPSHSHLSISFTLNTYYYCYFIKYYSWKKKYQFRTSPMQLLLTYMFWRAVSAATYAYETTDDRSCWSLHITNAVIAYISRSWRSDICNTSININHCRI